MIMIMFLLQGVIKIFFANKIKFISDSTILLGFLLSLGAIIANSKLLLKKIKFEKMNQNPQVYQQHPMFNQNKRKNMTQPVQQIEQQRSQAGNQLFSSMKRISTFASINQPPSKKIKLQQHHKINLTQKLKHDTGKKQSPIKLKNSQRKPLMERSINMADRTKKMNTFYSQWNPQLNQSKSKQQLKYSQMILMPQPRRLSLENLSLKNKSLSNQKYSRQNQSMTSKSRKKIQFTVYQNKMINKSPINQKSKLQNKCHIISKTNSLPYELHSTLSINLFSSQVNLGQSSIYKQKSKQKRNNLSTSSKKKETFHRSLSKNNKVKQIDLKINRTLQTIQSYKFVDSYLQKWQILQLLNGYQINGEPQCKWALLIVDEVFKRIRGQNKFEKIVSKS